jgi:hypothetical protein
VYGETMNIEKELALAEIEQHYPDQWVLVEETAWDKRGNPVRGVVRTQSVKREDLSAALKELHRRPGVKTFLFYTGDKIPEDLTVVL